MNNNNNNNNNNDNKSLEYSKCSYHDETDNGDI